MSEAEAKTDLVQGLRLRMPVPELSGYLQQALIRIWSTTSSRFHVISGTAR